MSFKILFATDGTDCAEHAIREGCRLLPVKGAVVTVVSVSDDESRTGGNQDADNDLARARKILEAAGCTLETVHAHGTPAEQILSTAHKFQPDCIVLGSTSLGGFGRLVFGSVSDDVVHGWGGAVLVVKLKR